MNVTEIRRILGVRRCVTCETDVMVLDEGYCPWCSRCPDTGLVLDEAAYQRDRWRRNQRAKRLRDKQEEEAA